jgi:hypothetical protein
MKAEAREPGVLRQLAPAACLAACLLLQGCGRSNPEPAPDILKAQREALEKAKSTEKMVQDAAQRRDAEMESKQK